MGSVAPPPINPTLTGILLVLGGSVVMSINDVAIKFLSGDYPLHQVILIRALIGLVFLVALIRLSGQSFALFTTTRRREHLIRVSIVMVSNVTYFVGLAAMPLADAVAVAYISPLLVTLLSVVLLSERVGPRRWAAVTVGMAGVVVMLRRPLRAPRLRIAGLRGARRLPRQWNQIRRSKTPPQRGRDLRKRQRA